MSKGIAIQTILLLLVGILVVGVLVYFVYSYTAGSTALSTTECLSIVTGWCTTCMVSDWNENISIPDDVETCGQQLRGCCWTDNSNCRDGPNPGNVKTDCCYLVKVGC